MLRLFETQPEKIDNSILTGQERFFGQDEIIVSKTDLKGKIIYANEEFSQISGFSEAELIGAPHSIVRHPHMPRCIFKYLWDELAADRDVFAYVNNRAINGDNYWVMAHVTRSYDLNNNIVAYHSTRRSPKQDTVKNIIAPFYKQLLDVEAKPTSRKVGLENSHKMLVDFVAEQGGDYTEFILSI